jgi:O-antigen/teichoic acid export membrane protein
MTGMAVMAQPIVKLVLTDKWLPCVPFMQMACFYYAFWPVHTSNLEALKAIGRSDLFLKLEIIKKTFGILLIVIFINKGVIMIAFSEIILTLIGIFINAYPNVRLLNYKIHEQLLDIVPNILLSVIMGLAVYSTNLLSLDGIALLFMEFLIGVSVYIGISCLFRLDSFIYLKSLVLIGFKRTRLVK